LFIAYSPFWIITKTPTPKLINDKPKSIKNKKEKTNSLY